MKTIKIKRRSELRDYDYVVTISAKTGRLVDIKAGCRTWHSFQAAHLHYTGELGEQSSKWRDATIAAELADGVERYTLYIRKYHTSGDALPVSLSYIGTWAMSYMGRKEARQILDRLEADVIERRRKIRSKRKCKNS